MNEQDGTISLSMSSMVRRSDDHLAAETGDELVLMSINRGNYYGLDPIGADIWRRMETPRTILDLCLSLMKDYEADEATIRRDVLALLERLVAEGLIEISI